MNTYFKTFGCKVNQYETELLRTRLEHSGGRTVRDHLQADVCVVNTCSVTAEADRECRQFVRKLLRENERARVVVTGCYATRAPEELRKISPRIETYSNRDKDALPSCFGFEIASQPLGISRFGMRSRAFLKVQDGCRAPCTYCIIPSVRPELTGKPSEEVLREARELVETGHEEIVLTGIRLGLYRSRKGTSLNLTGLLRELLKLPGRFRIRLSSIEVTEVSEELIRLVEREPRLCRHFHIPLQSGADPVLKAMGRWYKAKDYAERIGLIRSRLPDAGLTADVMVGFPAETDALFYETAGFIEDLELSGLHVFPFSRREGTKAAELDPLSPATVERRSRLLRKLDRTLRERFFRRFAGTLRETLVEPSGEGWTDNYIRVLAPAATRPGLARLPVAA